MGWIRARATSGQTSLVSDLAGFVALAIVVIVTPGAASFAILLALGLTFCLMTLTWLVAYAFVVARAGDVLRRSRVRRTIEGATGAVLIAFGVRVAATR